MHRHSANGLAALGFAAALLLALAALATADNPSNGKDGTTVAGTFPPSAEDGVALPLPGAAVEDPVLPTEPVDGTSTPLPDTTRVPTVAGARELSTAGIPRYLEAQRKRLAMLAGKWSDRTVMASVTLRRPASVATVLSLVPAGVVTYVEWSVPGTFVHGGVPIEGFDRVLKENPGAAVEYFYLADRLENLAKLQKEPAVWLVDLGALDDDLLAAAHPAYQPQPNLYGLALLGALLDE